MGVKSILKDTFIWSKGGADEENEYWFFNSRLI